MNQSAFLFVNANNLILMLFKDGTELQVFVAEVKKQIVGVAVIRREEVNFLLSGVYFILCSVCFSGQEPMYH